MPRHGVGTRSPHVALRRGRRRTRARVAPPAETQGCSLGGCEQQRYVLLPTFLRPTSYVRLPTYYRLLAVRLNLLQQQLKTKFSPAATTAAAAPAAGLFGAPQRLRHDL